MAAKSAIKETKSSDLVQNWAGRGRGHKRGLVPRERPPRAQPLPGAELSPSTVFVTACSTVPTQPHQPAPAQPTVTQGGTKSPRRSPLLCGAARPSGHRLSSALSCLQMPLKAEYHPRIAPKLGTYCKTSQIFCKNQHRRKKHP